MLTGLGDVAFCAKHGLPVPRNPARRGGPNLGPASAFRHARSDERMKLRQLKIGELVLLVDAGWSADTARERHRRDVEPCPFWRARDLVSAPRGGPRA